VSVPRGLQHELDRADELAAAGRFFDAHEELELAWKTADGETKVLLQGLIQLAAGLHRLKLSPEKPDGAFYLFDRGLDKLRKSRSLLEPDSLARLEAAVETARAAGTAAQSFRFGLRVAVKE
jgi:predicted metal-dependent hydrolase